MQIVRLNADLSSHRRSEIAMRMTCVIALSCLAGPACAQTSRLSDQEQALCQPDVIRFCLFKFG